MDRSVVNLTPMDALGRQASNQFLWCFDYVFYAHIHVHVLNIIYDCVFYAYRHVCILNIIYDCARHFITIMTKFIV